MTTMREAISMPRTFRVPVAARWGLALALIAGVISGFSVWVNSYAVKEVRDPAVFATAKNLIVGIALFALLLRPGTESPRLPATWRRRGLLVALGVIGGSIPFVLFFEGLARSGPGSAAFIQKTLFLWVSVLALPLLNERLGRWQVGALAMLFVAQLLIGRPTSWRIGEGELLVLVATGFWTVETIVARRVLPEVGAGLAATSRMALGGLLLLVYVTALGDAGTLVRLDAEQWRWVIVTSALLLLYVGTWYSALRRAPASAVKSLLAVGAPITALLATWDGKPAPNAEQLAGYLVLACAIGFLIGAARRKTPEEAVPA